MIIEADLDNVASSEPLAEEVLIAGENQAQLSGAIDQLPEKYRIPFVMAYQAHLSYDEITELLGLNRTDAGALLLRAKLQLRSTLMGSTQRESA